MKRLKNLWPQVLAFDNLLQAYKNARRGKQNRAEVAQFSLNLEYELLNLQRALESGTYQPAGYRQFQIYDRKPRTISVAPFRDRVCQHAVMNVVEPLLDKKMIAHSYACRKNKGVHAAVDQLQAYMQPYPYMLKLDIASYFPSIDHQRLKAKLAANIADKAVLWLFGKIIDSALDIPQTPRFVHPNEDLVDLMRPRGLAIGNLTSQFFGNFYLNAFDHWLKDDCGVKAYIRYVDDLVLLHSCKSALWAQLAAIGAFLERERLAIHPRKCWVQPSAAGVEFLGYRLWPHRRRLRADNGYQFRRRLKSLAKQYSQHRVNLADIQPKVAAWLGHAKHGETRQLVSELFFQVGFRRG